MSRINQDIVEFSYSSKLSNSYELSVLLGADSVYYLVNDAQLNVLVLRSYHFDNQKQPRSIGQNLKDVFFDDTILREPFRTIKVVASTPHFTLVPNKFFDANNQATYFQSLTQIAETDVCRNDFIRNANMNNVYLTDNHILNVCHSVFPTAKIYHSLTPLINGYQKISELRAGHQIFANIRDGALQICFFDGRELIFANNYLFKTAQDLIFYIMLVYEQFKLNPETTPLSISGALTENSDIFRYIYRYVRHAAFVSVPLYFRLGSQFTGVPQHFYFDLFSIKVCE